MREQGEKLVLGRVGIDELLAQSDVARLVFNQIKDPLDGLLRPLQTKQVDVHEMRHAGVVFEWLLDRLKGRPKSEHLLQRLPRSNFHFVVSCFSDVPAGGQISKTTGHLCKSLVRLDKAT